jgi:hypothetical protein
MQEEALIFVWFLFPDYCGDDYRSWPRTPTTHTQKETVTQRGTMNVTEPTYIIRRLLFVDFGRT